MSLVGPNWPRAAASIDGVMTSSAALPVTQPPKAMATMAALTPPPIAPHIAAFSCDGNDMFLYLVRGLDRNWGRRLRGSRWRGIAGAIVGCRTIWRVPHVSLHRNWPLSVNLSEWARFARNAQNEINARLGNYLAAALGQTWPSAGAIRTSASRATLRHEPTWEIESLRGQRWPRIGAGVG